MATPKMTPEEAVQFEAQTILVQGRIASFLEEKGINLDVSTHDGQLAMLSVIAIAAHRNLLELMKTGASEVDFARHLAGIREDMLRMLWREDRFGTAWAELIDIEFPGAEPDHVDLGYYAEDAAAHAAMMAKVDAASRKKCDEMFDFLAEHGYAVEEAEVRRVALLSSYAGWLAVHVEEIIKGGRMMIDPLLASTRELIERSEQPDHEAWGLFVKHFFGAIMDTDER